MLQNVFSFRVPSAALTFAFERPQDRVKNLTLRPIDDVEKSSHVTDVPLFGDGEAIRGKLIVKVESGKRLEHTGLALELLGSIEQELDHSAAGHEVLSASRALQSSGQVLEGDESFAFDFANVGTLYDSYYGRRVTLRYGLRATLARGKYASSIVHEQDVCIQQVVPPPAMFDGPLKMEVGIEECLHIEFKCDKSTYHLNDVVVGRISFVMVQIKIKHMELAILRRESVTSGAPRRSERDTVAKFEVMDGAPIEGESIPVRMYLAPYALAPTYYNVHGQFSVTYFLNLVLVDEDDCRYFKQQEITLWRKTVG